MHWHVPSPAAWLLLNCVLVLGGCATTPLPSAAKSGFKPVSPAVAAIQTRHYHRVSEAAVQTAATDLLQELGYTPGWSDSSLGGITASKNSIRRAPAERTPGEIILFPVVAALATVGDTMRGVPPDQVAKSIWPKTRDYPCFDRLLLTTSRAGTAGKCCQVRLLIQRTCWEPFCCGCVYTDSAAHNEIFNQLAVKLANLSPR
jgi:hypothetical protein